MKSVKFKYWQDGEWWIGRFEEYPDYITQGKASDELKENLASLYKDLISNNIPNIKRIERIRID